MKEDGNYFEMVQLASWIVKLQPRFTGATAYLAWNMAYNVSVTFNSFEDRWRWVQRGIELIRDEALLYNPGDPELFKELGWIYQHKLGQEMDDAQKFYKLQLARQVVEVLGDYPVDWEIWADTPVDEDVLRERLGEGATLWEQLQELDMGVEDVEDHFRQTGELPENLREAAAEADWGEPLELFVRVRWLRDILKLDATRIRDLNARYGDLDWRLPEAHAIYWASRGLEVADEGVDIACERMVFQSLSNAFRGGRLIFLQDIETLEITPNTSLVDAVNDSYLTSMGQHEGNRSIRSGYENFLIDAVVTLYTFGRTAKAREYYAKLREMFSNPKYARGLDEFALHELAGDVASATYDRGFAGVQGYLFQMCYALALGDYDRAEAFERIADRVHRKYQGSAGRTATRRRGLPPYRQMKKTTLKRCLEVFPPALGERLHREAGVRYDEELLREDPEAAAEATATPSRATTP